jgi:hypothetical protein
VRESAVTGAQSKQHPATEGFRTQKICEYKASQSQEGVIDTLGKEIENNLAETARYDTPLSHSTK